MSARGTSREEILKVVSEVFARRGYQAATVRELAHAAGVSQATLYYHIGSKAAALLDIHNAFVDSMITQLVEVRDSDIPAPHKIQRLMEVMLATIVSNRDQLALFLRERRSLPPDEQMQIKEKSDRIDAILAAILIEGNDASDWSECISLRAARLAIFGIVSWAVEWMDPARPEGPHDFAREFTQLVLYGLLRR